MKLDKLLNGLLKGIAIRFVGFGALIALTLAVVATLICHYFGLTAIPWWGSVLAAIGGAVSGLFLFAVCLPAIMIMAFVISMFIVLLHE